MDMVSAASLTGLIAAVGISINTFEIVIGRAKLFEFFEWPIIRTKYYWLLRHPRGMALFDFLFRPRLFVVLLLLQAGAALATPVVFAQRLPAVILCAYVLAIHLLIHFRLMYGMDGSDQMQTVVWGSLLLFNVVASVGARNAVMIFLAAQLALAYLTSGIAKLSSPIWRSGSAVGLIIRTRAYGMPFASAMVNRYRLSPVLSWATMILEAGGPLCILLGPLPTLIFLACGMAFHMGIAGVMGLNSFVWAFVATFPTVYYVSQLVRL